MFIYYKSNIFLSDSVKRGLTRSVPYRRLFAYQCDETSKHTKESNAMDEEVTNFEKRLSATLDQLNEKTNIQKRYSSKF